MSARPYILIAVCATLACMILHWLDRSGIEGGFYWTVGLAAAVAALAVRSARDERAEDRRGDSQW